LNKRSQWQFSIASFAVLKCKEIIFGNHWFLFEENRCDLLDLILILCLPSLRFQVCDCRVITRFKSRTIRIGAEMMTAETSVVDLDRVLAQDVEGTQVRELQKKLVDAAEQCRFRLDHGVSPEEAKRLNAMMTACSAGLGLLPALWQTQQERK
jgi:hypothetical protein